MARLSGLWGRLAYRWQLGAVTIFLLGAAALVGGALSVLALLAISLLFGGVWQGILPQLDGLTSAAMLVVVPLAVGSAIHSGFDILTRWIAERREGERKAKLDRYIA